MHAACRPSILRGVLATIATILAGAFVLAWLLAAAWVTVGTLLEALADWTADAAAWFRRHGV